jgi:hypothetical protein
MAVATLTQLIGGNFQDANGNPLEFGYLTLKLSQDGNVAGVGNICSGVTITIQLDINGNVASLTSPTPVANQYAWANSNIAPINTYYKVTGYTQEGQRAFGLNNQQVAAGATFNVGTWVPNSVLSWFPSPQPLALEVNGVPVSSQTINLEAGTNITITDEGGGTIEISATGSSESPTGVNVVPCPDMPIIGSSGAGLNGYTVILKIQASKVGAVTTSGLRVGLWTTGTTGLVVNTATIGATLPNSNTWTTSPVSFTFPAGSFVNPSTLYVSNLCPIEVDANHDYWVAIYFDPSSSGGNAYASLSSDIPAYTFWYSMSKYVIGNHANDSDASTLAAEVNNSTNWFCFGQVVVA